MINQSISPTQTSVADTTDLNAIRRAARENSPDALKAAARQFEALFVNMMLKSMRSATPQNGMFDSDQTRMYTTMLDQEMSQTFAKRGVGLADAMLRQMSNNSRPPLADIKADQEIRSDVPEATSFVTSTSPEEGKTVQATQAQMVMQETIEKQKKALFDNLATVQFGESSALNGMSGLSGAFTEPQQLMSSDSLRQALADTIRQQQSLLGVRQQSYSASAYSGGSSSSKPAHVRAFQERLEFEAEEASRTTGIPAKFMLGQAALESGWGRKVIRAADGSSSYNLFGIKAGKNWRGKVVETTTTEYVNGVAYRKKQKFRAYDSYSESFNDYARLLKNNPRYQNVLANAQDAVGFARGLQRAGYATDPQYAAKLTRIIQKSLSA
ncbi:MAG: flagellar assembly peptidoglycan hydrolase FlgJ [Burkholderiaceae bacterium]|nr:flagellar assembly peptidoglycan hydrolase FlgJ [Burkholderiaceae bacterium]